MKAQQEIARGTIIVFITNILSDIGQGSTTIRGATKFSSCQFAFNCINHFSRSLDNTPMGRYIVTRHVSLSFD
jgi:hypothetical protein